ncbi:MAG: transcriptional repressor LexA [Gammaproteobacteria bacterium]|nr:transcriptional repressor LexA [Gammaproteobacteria bacterium]
MKLTRRQQEIYETLRDKLDDFEHPPTYDELCQMLGLSSRGSLHKHIQALIQAGLIEPLDGQHRGIRLVEQYSAAEGLPYLGRIAAGKPIEAITHAKLMKVPDEFLGIHPCYVLQVSGDSMIEEGIFDGDYVVIEQQDTASNGEIVVALVNNDEVTLKKIEQKPDQVILYPANSEMAAMTFTPDQIQIQGVLRGLLRSYR